MPRPGTDVTILDDATPGGPSLNTGQAFFVGIAASGPTDGALQRRAGGHARAQRRARQPEPARSWRDQRRLALALGLSQVYTDDEREALNAAA
jgi:hypothetical protein